MKSYLTRSLIASIIALFTVGSAGAAEKKNDWTLSFPETKAHFVKVQMAWAKKDGNWQPTKEQLEAMFDAADANKDGSLTEEEWKKRDKGKPGKKAKKKE